MQDKILTTINRAIDEYRKNKKSEKFSAICNEVLTENNPQHCLTFAKAVRKYARDMDVRPFGNVVADLGTAEQNYLFASKVKGAITQIHRDKIIESGSVEFNLLATTTNCLNDKLQEMYASKHGAVLLEKGGVMMLAEFLCGDGRYIDDKTPYLEKIVRSKQSPCNLKVAKFVKGIDIEPHSIVVAENGTAKENFEFLKVAGCNKKRHLQAIINSNDAEINLRTIESIKDIPVVKHLRVIFESDNNLLKYKALVWVNQLGKGAIKELNKYIPQVAEFVMLIKTGQIDARQLGGQSIKDTSNKTR